MGTKFLAVAQLDVQGSSKPKVVGSSPTREASLISKSVDKLITLILRGSSAVVAVGC